MRRLTCNNSIAYPKNWTDNFFQIFFMGTSWVGVSINNITTRASREMTSRKNINIFDFNGVNVAKHWHVAGRGICHLWLPCWPCITPVVNSKERTRIATPWSTWRCTLVLSTTVRKVCGLSCILMKFSTLIHVICYNIMPIPCVFVWGLRIDDLRIYVYSNLLKNWSLVHTIPYYRPQPILLADEMD